MKGPFCGPYFDIMEKLERRRPVWVIGHKNPDTDSICAAIAYANLKNQTDAACERLKEDTIAECEKQKAETRE